MPKLQGHMGPTQAMLAHQLAFGYAKAFERDK